MKVIIYAHGDDLLFGIRAAKSARDAGKVDAAYQYGDAPDAPVATVRMNNSGSWSVWVSRRNSVAVVEP